jgi:hypothetical protein
MKLEIMGGQIASPVPEGRKMGKAHDFGANFFLDCVCGRSVYLRDEGPDILEILLSGASKGWSAHAPARQRSL